MGGRWSGVGWGRIKVWWGGGGGGGGGGGELRLGGGGGEFGRRGLLGEIFPSQGNELIFG